MTAIRQVFSAGALAMSILLAGCVPVPRSRNVAKVGTIEREKPKLNFLTPGVTKLDDLRKELQDLNTDATRGNFLWARWSSLNVKIDWFPTVWRDTFWSTKNLLAVFDDDGILVEYRFYSDRDLPHQLPRILDKANYTPPDDAVPIELRARHWSTWSVGTDYFGILTFEQSGISFTQPNPNPGKAPVNFTLPFSGIREISAGSGMGMQLPVEAKLSLRLKIDSGIAPFTTLEADALPSEAVRVFWLLEQDSGHPGAH